MTTHMIRVRGLSSDALFVPNYPIMQPCVLAARRLKAVRFLRAVEKKERCARQPNELSVMMQV
jgi:hypothetical protein